MIFENSGVLFNKLFDNSFKLEETNKIRFTQTIITKGDTKMKTWICLITIDQDFTLENLHRITSNCKWFHATQIDLDSLFGINPHEIRYLDNHSQINDGIKSLDEIESENQT